MKNPLYGRFDEMIDALLAPEEKRKVDKNMLTSHQKFPEHRDDAWMNLKRAASKEAEAFSEARDKVRDAAINLQKVVADEFKAWRILIAAEAAENRVCFYKRHKAYEFAREKIEAALQKAAAGEWTEYVQLDQEMHEAEAELAKAAPVEWTWWRLKTAQQT